VGRTYIRGDLFHLSFNLCSLSAQPAQAIARKLVFSAEDDRELPFSILNFVEFN
jgi:hypothetical protein